eukprot:10838547-Karenia_brevis.AAC.1
MGAGLLTSAYGLKDALRLWWNRLDRSLRQYGLIPTRADRCCYVLYSNVKSETHMAQEAQKSQEAH